MQELTEDSFTVKETHFNQDFLSSEDLGFGENESPSKVQKVQKDIIKQNDELRQKLSNAKQRIDDYVKIITEKDVEIQQVK